MNGRLNLIAYGTNGANDCFPESKRLLLPDSDDSAHAEAVVSQIVCRTRNQTIQTEKEALEN